MEEWPSVFPEIIVRFLHLCSVVMSKFSDASTKNAFAALAEVKVEPKVPVNNQGFQYSPEHFAFDEFCICRKCCERQEEESLKEEREYRYRYRYQESLKRKR
jgi:hypothetical protein